MAVDTDLIDPELLVEPVGERDAGLEAAGDETAAADPQPDDASVFEAHADRWYRPDSDTYDWAVRTRAGERRYFKTRSGARDRLRAEYE